MTPANLRISSHRWRRSSRRRVGVIGRVAGCAMVAVMAMLVTVGCQGPDKAAIELRKQLQASDAKVAALERAIEAQKASIKSLESRSNTIASLPDDRVGKLFTAHGIKLNRLTGGADYDPAVQGDEGLKIYATPVDDEGEPLKAAGSFVVEAFDLSSEKARVGSWTFDTDRTRRLWHGQAMLYEFVLPCPFDQPPAHKELLLKVRFTDELTGRAFEAQKNVTIK